jgi:DNA-binding XRE family transcriptional regulator
MLTVPKKSLSCRRNLIQSKFTRGAMKSILNGVDAKNTRDKLGMSQRELADTLGVSTATVNSFERSLVLKPMVSLALECLVRRRQVTSMTPVSPEERAERVFRQRAHYKKLQAEQSVEEQRAILAELQAKMRPLATTAVFAAKGPREETFMHPAWENYNNLIAEYHRAAAQKKHMHVIAYCVAASNRVVLDDDPLLTPEAS